MKSPLYVAIDTPDLAKAQHLAGQVRHHVGGLKLGLEFFCANGHHGVHEMMKFGLPIFLDLKFHDIPNTVAQAVRSAANLGVWMVNVHASGGMEMMKAAKNAIAGSSHPQTKLIAVTVLTSMDQAQLNDVVPEVSPAEQVKKLAQLTADSGLDGVVCSAKEAVMLRETHNDEFLFHIRHVLY